MKSNFFDTNSYFIDEKVNYFKFENCYQIFNEKGENIGTIAQKIPTLHKILSLIINKGIFPFHLEIRNSNDELQASISRGWTFLMSKIVICDQNGIQTGTIQQKFKLFTPTYKIFNNSDVQIAEITGDFRAWDFVIKDINSIQIGTISKKWAGVMKELFTTADKYNVSIDSSYSNNENKINILASAITIDMVMKSR